MLWTWDLTRTLGWQSLAPPARQRLGSADSASLHAAGSADYGVGNSISGAAESWAQPGNGTGCWLSTASLPEEVRKEVLWRVYRPCYQADAWAPGASCCED